MDFSRSGADGVRSFDGLHGGRGVDEGKEALSLLPDALWSANVFFRTANADLI